MNFPKKLATLVVLLVALGVNNLTAQILSEDFQAGIPVGWALIDNDGLTPDVDVNFITAAWTPLLDNDDTTDVVAASTSWYDPAGTADDWLITPQITLTTNNVLSWNAKALDPSFADGYEVRISTTTPTIGGFNANAPLYTNSGETDTWTSRSVNLQTAGYTNQNVYIAFRNNSTDKYLLFIDDIVVAQQANNDVAVQSVSFGEYSYYPLSQVRPINLSGLVENLGANTATNVTLSVTVEEINSGSQVYTNSAFTASLNSGSSTTLTMGNTFTPNDTGTYLIEFIVSMTQADDNVSNDTLIGLVAVDETMFARDYALFGSNLSAIGYNNFANQFDIGQTFELIAGDTLESVEFYSQGDLGDTVWVNIYNFSSATGPGTLVASTVPYILSSPIDTANLFDLNIAGGPVNLSPGEYFFGVRGGRFVGTTDLLYTPGSVWGGPPGSFIQLDTVTGNSILQAFVIWPKMKQAAVQGGPSKIRLSFVDAVNDIVIIKNFGGTADDISGFRLCSNLVCNPSPISALTVLSGSLNLAAGDSVILSGFAIDTAGADLGLYTPTGAFTDTATMVDFTQWKSAGNGRESVAVSKGIWGVGDFIMGGSPYNYIGNGFQDGVTYWEGQQVTGPTNCDTLTNVFTADSLSLYGNADGGYAFGHNGTGFPAFAQHFQNSNTVEIGGGTFFFGDAQFGSPTSFITATVWDVSSTPGGFGNPNRPGSILATENILISDIADDITNLQLTDFTFTTPPTVTGDFYLGFSVTHAASDTVGLVTNDFGQSTPPASLWVSVDNIVSGEWARADSLFDDGTISGYIWANVCSTSACPTINVNVATTDAQCSTPGSAMASATGGAGSYTYQWSGGQSGPSVSGLAAGTYSVTATDGNNCTGEASFTINQAPNSLSISIATTTNNISCAAPNGKAVASVSGGNAPYVFTWSSGASVDSATGLAGGTYSVTVLDVTGCTDTASVTIADNLPTILVAQQSNTPNTQCGIPNGSITVAASGGTGPYSYSDGNSTNSTGTFSNVVGQLTITATDANGCSGSMQFTVADNAPSLTVAESSNTANNSCGTPNGSVTVQASGGQSPYSYTDGNTTNSTGTFSNVVGTFTIDVTDANGCAGSRSVTVADNALALTVTETNNAPNTSCSNPNGSVTVSASGGTGPYTYNDGNSTNNTGLFNNKVGTFNVTATDANGCVGTLSVTVADNAPNLNVSVTNNSPNTSCSSSNGTFTVSASGGTAPYSYDNGNTTNSNGVFNNVVGAFTVNVTDADGCTGSTNVTVADNSGALTVTETANTPNTSCGAPNGSFTVSASGGTGPYSYNNGSSTNTTGTFSGVSGMYTVNVTDANSCVGSIQVTVASSIPAINITPSITDVSCNGGDDGAISLLITPTLSYTYMWSDNSTTQNVTSLDAGSYGVTVTDPQSGCTSSISVNVNEPTVLTASVSTTDESAVGAADGTATVSASGGTSPYDQDWSNTETTTTITGLSAGTYDVTVTDDNGCTATASGVVDVSVGIEDEEQVDVSLYPNPTSGLVQLELNISATAQVEVEWFNMLGEQVAFENIGEVKTWNSTFDLSAFSEGLYFVKIKVGSEFITRKVQLTK